MLERGGVVPWYWHLQSGVQQSFTVCCSHFSRGNGWVGSLCGWEAHWHWRRMSGVVRRLERTSALSCLFFTFFFVQSYRYAWLLVYLQTIVYTQSWMRCGTRELLRVRKRKNTCCVMHGFGFVLIKETCISIGIFCLALGVKIDFADRKIINMGRKIRLLVTLLFKACWDGPEVESWQSFSSGLICRPGDWFELARQPKSQSAD